MVTLARRVLETLKRAKSSLVILNPKGVVSHPWMMFG